MTVLAQARIFRMDLPVPLTELGAAFAVSGHAAYAVGSAAAALATAHTPRRLDVVTDAPVDVAVRLAYSTGLVDSSLPPLHLSDSMADLWLPGGLPLRIRTITPPLVLGSAGSHLGGLADVLADVSVFSVSAVAVNLADGGVYDPHGGLRDLRAGRLRLLASPSTASATAVFLLAAEFGLRVPPRLRGRLLSADRADAAATRALLADIVALPDPMVPVRRAHRAGGLEVSLPEVAGLFLGDRQGRHKDILVHTLQVVARCDPADPLLRAAALLHDLGKPATRRFTADGVTFTDHDAVGARLAASLLRRLDVADPFVSQVVTLVATHLRTHDADLWSDSAVRRFDREMGGLLDRALDLAVADATSRYLSNVERVRLTVSRLRSRIVELREADRLRSLRTPVDGHAVMSRLGLSPGPKLGEVMGLLYEAVRANPDLTEVEAWAIVDGWAAGN